MGEAAEPSEPLEKGKHREPATKPQRDELRVKMWYVPYQSSGSSLYDDPPPELIPESIAQVDAREWLQRRFRSQIPGKLGDLHFAPGEEAFFNGRLRVLMVRASPATIALIDNFARSSWKLEAVESVLRVEASLVEFSAPQRPELDGKTSVESLRKAAGDSWRVLNRIHVNATPGNRATAISKTGAPVEPPVAHPPGKDQTTLSGQSPVLLPGEFGAMLDIEPAFGAGEEQEEIIDVNLYYQFRAPGPPAWNWKTTTSVSVKKGRPMLLQVDSAAPEGDRSHPAKLRGLILKVDVIRFGQVIPHPEGRLGPPPIPLPPE